jgi:hypothetical protein
MMNHTEIVGDKQVRKPPFLLKPRKKIDDLRADRNVQCTHGLVGDDDTRLNRKRARNADPLALSTAEFMRKSIDRGWIQPNLSKEFMNSCPSFSTPRKPVNDQRLG